MSDVLSREGRLNAVSAANLLVVHHLSHLGVDCSVMCREMFIQLRLETLSGHKSLHTP